MNILARLILLISIVFLVPVPGHAAFPISAVQPPVMAGTQNAGVVNNSERFAGKLKHVSVWKRVLDKADKMQMMRPVKYQWAAIILACTSLLFGGLGLHRFYLGYTGIGFIQLSGLLWIGLGAVYVIGGIFSVMPSLAFLGSIMLGVGIGLYIWQIFDLIRIAAGRLRPKKVDYDYHRFPAYD